MKADTQSPEETNYQESSDLKKSAVTDLEKWLNQAMTNVLESIVTNLRDQTKPHQIEELNGFE